MFVDGFAGNIKFRITNKIRYPDYSYLPLQRIESDNPDCLEASTGVNKLLVHKFGMH
jgi:hypothetical protein